MLVEYLGDITTVCPEDRVAPVSNVCAEEKDQVSSFLGTRCPSRMLVIDEITPTQ